MSVETSISEGIAEIILDCPPVNALTSSEWLDLAINIDNLAHNNDVRVIVISAKGNGFCAGADIKELQENPSKITDVNDGCWKTARAIHVSNVPVISACHGFILGGGILLAGVLVLYWAYDKVIGIDNMKLG